MVRAMKYGGAPSQPTNHHSITDTPEQTCVYHFFCFPDSRLNYLKRLLSVIARSWTLTVLAKIGGQSVFTKIRAASCRCFASLPLSRPFMIR